MMRVAAESGGGSRAARASPTPPPTRRPWLSAQLSARPHVKRARVDAREAVGALVAAPRPLPVPRPPPLRPSPPPLPTPTRSPPLDTPRAGGPLPDPALQRAVGACASWRDCAALLEGPHAPRLDAMLVSALATRAAHLVVAAAAASAEGKGDAAAADGPSGSSSSSPPPSRSPFAAFVSSLASAALERAPSSRPQQFAQVAVSIARLACAGQRGGAAVARSRRSRSGSGGSGADAGAGANADADLPSLLRPWLERYLAAAEVHLPRFSERRLCQLAWAAATLWTAGGAEGAGASVQLRPQQQQQPKQTPLPPLPAGERWWGALLSEAQDRLPTLRDGRDWSNLLWALARLGLAVPPGWADDALAALTRAGRGGDNNGDGAPSSSSSSLPVLAAMLPRERATALWALARMGVVPPPGWVSRELGPALLRGPSSAERRAERARRRERRERPWATRRTGLAGGDAGEEDEDEAVEESESARDAAATLWALARWQQQAGGAAALAPPRVAALLAARAADAHDRELPPPPPSSAPAPFSSSSCATTGAASRSLVVALGSLARLPGALDDGDQQHCRRRQLLWLSLARRALPSLSGRGLARLARAVREMLLRPTGGPLFAPPADWMRALQARALALAAGGSHNIRAGELAAVLRLFAAVRWFPGAAWWAALLSAAERTGLVRGAPLLEVLALARAARAALGVVIVGAGAERRGRRRTGGVGCGDEADDGAKAEAEETEGLLASVLLLGKGRGNRRGAAVARWAQALWARVSLASDDASEEAAISSAAGGALAPAGARSAR